MAIYAEKFPEAITHLEKHAAMVREMATSQNSNGWCVHDQRLKMDRQVRGLPWEVFNIEFYKSVCNQNLTTFLKPVFVGFFQLLYDPSVMNYTSISASLSL
jgi:hypothetical protein